MEKNLSPEDKWVSGYQRLESALTREGFRVEYCGGACPVQIGGWMPEGEYFYFRSRGEHVSLEVWQKDFDPKEPHMGWCPASNPAFYLSKRAYAWPKAGWLMAHEANKHLRRFLRVYRKWKKKPFPIPEPKRRWSLKKHKREMNRYRKNDKRRGNKIER